MPSHAYFLPDPDSGNVVYIDENLVQKVSINSIGPELQLRILSSHKFAADGKVVSIEIDADVHAETVLKAHKRIHLQDVEGGDDSDNITRDEYDEWSMSEEEEDDDLGVVDARAVAASGSGTHTGSINYATLNSGKAKQAKAGKAMTGRKKGAGGVTGAGTKGKKGEMGTKRKKAARVVGNKRDLKKQPAKQQQQQKKKKKKDEE